MIDASHSVWKSLGGVTIRWNSVVTEPHPGHNYQWDSAEYDLRNVGWVTFKDANSSVRAGSNVVAEKTSRAVALLPENRQARGMPAKRAMERHQGALTERAR